MHAGDRQGHPFLAGTAALHLAAFRKGLVETGFVEGHNGAMMPTMRKQPSDRQSWPPIWFFVGWPSSPGALGKWFVKSALSFGDFRS